MRVAVGGLGEVARRPLAHFGEDDVGGPGQRTGGRVHRVRSGRRIGGRQLSAHHPSSLDAETAARRASAPLGDCPPAATDVYDLDKVYALVRPLLRLSPPTIHPPIPPLIAIIPCAHIITNLASFSIVSHLWSSSASLRRVRFHNRSLLLSSHVPFQQPVFSPVLTRQHINTPTNVLNGKMKIPVTTHWPSQGFTLHLSTWGCGLSSPWHRLSATICCCCCWLCSLTHTAVDVWYPGGNNYIVFDCKKFDSDW